MKMHAVTSSYVRLNGVHSLLKWSVYSESWHDLCVTGCFMRRGQYDITHASHPLLGHSTVTVQVSRCTHTCVWRPKPRIEMHFSSTDSIIVCERERERVSVCVCEREWECVCVCVREREREREYVCVCVRVRVCVWESVCLCVCVCVCTHIFLWQMRTYMCIMTHMTGITRRRWLMRTFPMSPLFKTLINHTEWVF